MRKRSRPSSRRRRQLASLLALAFAGFTTAGPRATESSQRPNVVFILADDLGWSDTTLYGTTTFYETPNIERLAQRGLLFTNAYTAHPLCSPTRASIMTGQAPGRIGFTSAAGHLKNVVLEKRLEARARPGRKVLTPRSITRLDTSYTTLAETLRAAGYVTGHFGKWHLGRDPYSPREHGFDVDVPHWWGPGPAGSYVAPWRFPKDLDFDPATPDEHIEDRTAREATAFIEKNQNRPFFLNYWAFSVHAPFDGKRKLIDKYRAKADPRNPQRLPVYGAMVESLDDAVGELLDALDRLELAEKTIIVFFSDNGGNMYNRIEGIPPTSNSPLRGGKATIYDGGTRVPCVVVWPGKARPASRTDAFLTSTDWYPTLLEMLEIEKPADVRFDGVSQVPAILGKAAPRESFACFVPNYYPATGNVPSTYFREGDWKLIRFHGEGEAGKDRFALYNLKNDIGEARDLAGSEPERVKRMDAEIARYLEDIEAVVPKPVAAPRTAARPSRAPAAKKVDDRNERGDRPNIIIVYTDDHGYADLGCQGVLDDIRTPHTDRLAREGVRLTSGYASAPQCRPSRAGLLTGRYQNRFGLEENGDGALPWSESTVAERLAEAGYVTGMCGKWHLDGSIGSNGERPDGTKGERPRNKAAQYRGDRLANPGQVQHHGFREYLSGPMRSYVASHSPAGRDMAGPVVHVDERYRLDVQAEWAVSFIKRHASGSAPFFLYVPFFAPHVPLEAPEKYIRRFPGEMPRRRRLALAMISAMDDGIGMIRRTLEEEGIARNTLVFYISDNGAPLKIHKIDAPGGGPGWDGSLNDPWIGEKGMLTEGGIRVPFLVSWPARLPAGKTYHRPVIALDASATALSVAGLEVGEEIDGVDLVPYLTGERAGDPHAALYWRWRGQAAIRAGDWKYLIGGGGEYLFNLATREHESRNLIGEQAERATQLRAKLDRWARTLVDPGLPTSDAAVWSRFYDHYLNGKPASRPAATREAPKKTAPRRRRDPEVIFKARDRDGDGSLTLKEYIGDPATRNVPALTTRFRRLDTNKDSRLTLDEMKTGGK